MAAGAQIARAEFDRAYNEAILGRTFVEFVEYYEASRTRFWKSFRYVEALGLPQGAKVIDIGGGIMAVLTRRLLGFDAHVFDVTPEAEADITGQGLSFALVDLFRDELPDITDADLVILTEVIEHIPKPPYLVLQKLAGLLKPGGYLFLTAPNGHRFRNLVYMVLGREILGLYRYPQEGQALGHQHEYTLKQMRWQADLAGLEVVTMEYYEDAFAGASTGARIGRILAKPAQLVPYWRNGLAIVLRKSAAAQSTG